MKRFALLLIALALFGTACAQGNVFSLTVGDCFNDPETNAAGEVSDVEMVDCGDLHDNEVYAAFNIPGSVFPGQSSVEGTAGEGCLSRFDDYVGTPYLDSSLEISFFTPTTSSWAQDDREVLCFVYDLNGNQLSTLVKGTGI